MKEGSTSQAGYQEPAINQDHVRWEDIAAHTGDVNESSSTNADPNFDNYDPANKILELNASSPAYTEGFVDIAGVTDGGTFTWGSPDGPAGANSGYDRSNY